MGTALTQQTFACRAGEPTLGPFSIEDAMPSIHTLMTPNVISFRETTPITEALECLIENKISGAPVVGPDNHIVGVVSEVDLLSLFWEKEAKTVGDLMTKSPV